MTIFHKIGDCERSKDWCTSQDLLTQLGPFTVLFMTTKMDNRRIKSASKWFLLRLKRRKPVAISYHQVRTVKRKLPREDLVKQWLQHDE